MKNLNQPAFSSAYAPSNDWSSHYEPGLTKLEYLSGLAMQGLIIAFEGGGTIGKQKLASRAIEYAKALLAELEKETANQQNPQP